MFTICLYKKKKQWSKPLIAVMEKILKIQAQSLKITQEVAQLIVKLPAGSLKPNQK